MRPIQWCRKTRKDEEMTVDVEAEKKILAQLAQDWYAAESRKDVEAEMAFLSDDIIFQPHNTHQLIGKKAVRKFISEFHKVLVSVSGSPTRIEVSSSGDFAYDIGRGKAVIMGPEGAFEHDEKYLIVWRKIDGKWKCVAWSFNSDKPPT